MALVRKACIVTRGCLLYQPANLSLRVGKGIALVVSMVASMNKPCNRSDQKFLELVAVYGSGRSDGAGLPSRADRTEA
jgi:hypothetical protein